MRSTVWLYSNSENEWCKSNLMKALVATNCKTAMVRYQINLLQNMGVSTFDEQCNNDEGKKKYICTVVSWQWCIGYG